MAYDIICEDFHSSEIKPPITFFRNTKIYGDNAKKKNSPHFSKWRKFPKGWVY